MVLYQVNEDLDNLAKTIEDLSVKVYRPNVFDFSKVYSSPFWSSLSNNAYNVRSEFSCRRYGD